MEPTSPESRRRRPRCLVVYESMFDNTEDIAWAIAEGLADAVDVVRTEVRSAPTRLVDIDLLVVGAPTHAFGLSRPDTRTTAAAKGAERDAAIGIGVREWLQRLERPAPGLRAATFDTRLRHPRPPGSAARAIRRRLRQLGVEVPAAPASFSVVGTQGPLVEGEQWRAEEWGQTLAATFGSTRGSAAHPSRRRDHRTTQGEPP